MARCYMITGAEGQDGIFLLRQLVAEDTPTKIVAVLRPKGTRQLRPELQQVLTTYPEAVSLAFVDINDANAVQDLVKQYEPRELYHLAAQSFVGDSYLNAATTLQTNAVGTLNILEAVRQHCPDAAVYIAATSEMFSGAMTTVPQNERTRLDPQSPYGVSKAAAYQLASIYRQAYGLRVWQGILFNHESQLRGEQFVTQKIATAAARIQLKQQQRLSLGNTLAQRDWGYAPEYVAGMVGMLRKTSPDVFVLATGIMTMVGEFADYCFRQYDMDWRDYTNIDQTLKRPTEVPHLCGDASKAYKVFGWKPETTVQELAQLMTTAAYHRYNQ